MKLPRRRQFLHLAAGAAALPAVSRFAWAQAYPSRPVRIIVAVRSRRRDRHRRAPDGSMAVGAARPAIRYREPAGRRQQYRHRGGRARAAGRLYAPPGRLRRTRSTRRSTTSSISISSATSRRSRASSALPNVMVVNPSVPAKTVPEFIAYAKANPGKINMASAGIGTAAHVAGELFKMMAGVDMVHVPYRGGAPALTDLLGGQVQVMFLSPCGVNRIHQERQAARARGDDRRLARRGCRTSRPWASSCRATRRARGWHRRTQGHARRDHRQAQQRDQRGPRRSQDQGAACRPGRHAACGSPADFGKLIAEETEKWAKVIQFGGHQAGVTATRATFHKSRSANLSLTVRFGSKAEGSERASVRVTVRGTCRSHQTTLTRRR